MPITDEEAMLQAIKTGELGRITAPPNPWVGCVIVKNDRIAATGYHKAAGMPHAETNALASAGELAQDSTVYVTLEPCAHWGKTPPCVDSLIKARVSRVVIGVLDPDERVQGKGIALLKDAGIEVEVGVLQAEVEKSLAPYLHHRKTGRPFCILKAAVSLDGKIADANGASKWISSGEARADVHQLRAESQAILIGAGTAAMDLPSLNVRNGIITERKPLRILLDPNCSVKIEGPLFDTSIAQTLIFTAKTASSTWMEARQSLGIEVHQISEIEEMLQFLGKRGVLQLLVEGGSQIYQLFLESRNINELRLYMGPCALGSSGKSLFSGEQDSIEKAPRFSLKDYKCFGDTMRLIYV